MSKILKKSQKMGHLRTLLTDDPKIDGDNRTVELTWSTGFKGLRSDWDGSYYEELSMDPKHVDMSRLQTGAPLLAAHNSHDLNAVIGVVERAWLEGDSGKALVRFSTDPEADKIYQKVKEKVLRNVSVGYRVRKYVDVTQKGDAITTLRAINWQPHEISIVPIGFDPNAQVREQDKETEVEIEINEEKTEPVLDSQTVEAQATDAIQEERTMTEAEKLALEQAAKKQAALEEKQRQNEIRSAVRGAKLDEKFADELINQDLTADQARKLVIEKLATTSEIPVASGSPTVEVGGDNHSKRMQGFKEALLHRANPKIFKSTELSKDFAGKSLLRQIEQIIPRYTGESDVMYAKRTMSSSDLPLALANVAEKGLQESYNLQPKTHEAWSKSSTLRNYKVYSQVKSGDFPALIERPEGAEFELGSFGEDRETVQLKDYGIKVAFTSQMLVNDDMSVITRLSSETGASTADLENHLAYSALTTNKTMNDSIALYHASHGNLGSTGAINATTVAEAYKLMRKQTSTDGLRKLNLQPTILVCGPDKEAEALQFFAPVNAQQTSNVNIYSGRMQVVVDAEITGNQFYFISPRIDGIVCYRLEGQEQPQVESQVNFNTNSLELKVGHAFAAAPMDWRPIVKNAGA
jgi:HK97 family phage prohead protease